MKDIEIYELAQSVLVSITKDLNDGIYSEVGGKLQFFFSDTGLVSAWASSKSDTTAPPEHEIVFCYELVRRLYRDCEGYYEFASTAMTEEPFLSLLQHFKKQSRPIKDMNKKSAIHNMFMGSLTWVYYHELGHLMQEHGYIRKKYAGLQEKSYIEDCESTGEHQLSGRDAVISHVTELAADVEATQWCMQELIRHFLPNVMDNDENDLKEFKNTLHLFICGLSCTLYRFYGERPLIIKEEVEGSHPYPIRRLDLCISNMYEKLDFNGYGEVMHSMNRTQLVHLCLGAAESVGFYWLWKYSQKPVVPENFLAGAGIFFDPYKKSYWSSIIKVWDEIEPDIKEIRRFGNELGILTFTDYTRSDILGDSK